MKSRVLKVTGINHEDLFSSSFNGLSIRDELAKKQISYNLLSDVNYRDKRMNFTPPIFKAIRSVLAKFEYKTGFQARVYFYTSLLAFRTFFRKSDVIHYHILHNNYFRLESLRFLTRKKPSLWTIHDLWLVTGHCIQPLDCSQWINGCGNCPDLVRTIPVDRDRTRQERKRKQRIVDSIDMEFHVPTEFMRKNLLMTSSIKPERIHVVPFGVNQEIFHPDEVSRHDMRQSLGINAEDFVIFVNARNDYIKGIDIVKSLVNSIDSQKNLKIIAIDQGRLFMKNPRVISIPTINEPMKMASFMRSSDLTLVPSRGESFSLITLESMASGTPVLVLEGSAPQEVSGAHANFVFSKSDSVNSCEERILYLSRNREILAIEKKRILKMVDEKYSLTMYAEQMSELYRKVETLFLQKPRKNINIFFNFEFFLRKLGLPKRR